MSATTLINKITHKEIMILYGLSRVGAQERLTAIRATLGKTIKHTLTVIDFCKVEDIRLDDFDKMMDRATKKI